MGVAQSQYADYINGFGEVALRTRWKVGLIIDVAGRGLFIVTRIAPNRRRVPGLLYMNTAADAGTAFMYVYEGPAVEKSYDAQSRDTKSYEIYLKRIVDGRIGGASVVDRVGSVGAALNITPDFTRPGGAPN
jgi:hypothetical protein